MNPRHGTIVRLVGPVAPLFQPLLLLSRSHGHYGCAAWARGFLRNGGQRGAARTKGEAGKQAEYEISWRLRLQQLRSNDDTMVAMLDEYYNQQCIRDEGQWR